VATCVVIASDADVRSVIEAGLKHLGLDTRGISSLGELPAIVRDVPVGGILLELVTSLKSSAEEKEEAKEVLHLYPFARFRLVGDQINILGDGNSIEDFAARCRQAMPRVIRREARECRYLAVYLSADDGFEDAEKTVTINVSKGGCFVYSNREWRIGNCVWLRFLGQESAVSGTVRFWREWGNDEGIPGVGVKYDSAPS